jgi:hypothetical protein
MSTVVMKERRISRRVSDGFDGLTASRMALRALLVMAAVTLVTAIAPARGSAASAARGCFTYQGAGVRGLGTVLQYQTRSGGWAYLGAPSVTRADGCVRYALWGTWRNFNVRIVAAAPLSDGRTLAWAPSRYYAPWGTEAYFLGSRPLSFVVVNPNPWDVTGNWLSEMDHPDCSASAAMSVACYMRQHGMVSNPISFPDWDRDGYWDLADRYPDDPRYH